MTTLLITMINSITDLIKDPGSERSATSFDLNPVLDFELPNLVTSDRSMNEYCGVNYLIADLLAQFICDLCFINN